MKRGLLIREPAQDWARRAYESLLPGAHAAVFGNPRVPQEAEDAGFEVRDCILVIGPVMHHIWLLRRPISEPTVAQQVLKTGTGGLWIDGCRVLTQDNLNGGAYTKGAGPHARVQAGGYEEGQGDGAHGASSGGDSQRGDLR